MKNALIFATLCVFLLVQMPRADAATVVPPGNRSATQPAIPSGSVKRSRRLGYQKKYEKIRDLLASDRKLRGKIRAAAKAFGIDPIHLVGALVGEHTYNVDAMDRLQTYYVKALSYLSASNLDFQYKGTPVLKFLAQPPFRKCETLRASYDRWTCRENVWNASYRGKNVGGRSWPNDRFGRVFFQPLYAGQTFGLGQLNPLTAFKVNDIVRRRFRSEPKLSLSKPQTVYNTIMEPDSTLIYMAAVLRHAIDSYRDIAGMDISNNPGVTATLYNLGNVTLRAQALKRENAKRRAKGQKPKLPQENYYGWLVNEKLSELERVI